MKTSVKNLIMFIVATVAGLLSVGIPATKSAWIVLSVTVIGSTLTYVGKNFAFPSLSVFGTIDLRDVISAVILSIGTGISNFLGNLAAGTAFNWHDLWVAVITVVIGYFAKNFANNGKTTT